MKKYTIHYNYYATHDVEVLAESEDEALKKARRVEIDFDNLFLTQNEETVLEAVDVPNLQTLIEKAEDIVKEADQDDAEIKLSPWPRITIEYWTGYNVEHKKELMEDLFWDYERNEIGFNTEDSSGDIGLSEIPEVEQFNICQAIINSKKEGGRYAKLVRNYL